MSRTVEGRQRTALFARFSLIGALVTALGALFAGFPELLAMTLQVSMRVALQVMFALYGLLGIAAGLMHGASTFGWPLVMAGGLKIVYDLLLLGMFRKVHPPEETASM